MYKVIKRDGRQEQYQVEKVKAVVEWATEGLDVNPLELESKIDQFLHDGITTKDIHENIIHHAFSICSASHPDWNIVAGRLMTMNRWKETGIFDLDLKNFIREQCELGIYEDSFFSKYSDEDIDELDEHLVQERDLNHSCGSVMTATKKYLLDGECIQQMFMCNAMIIASVEKRKADRMDRVKQIYDALSMRKISLATPWLSNLRDGGNISSCFIIQIDDNIDSIFDNVKNAAKISKMGGGVGIDLSNIRALGSSVNGMKNASGGVQGWCKILNDTAVAVNQGGKRAGAFTVHLPIWHKDIELFLDIQSENGDQRGKSHDLFLQIGVYDRFMKEQLKEDGGTWYTFCPFEVRTELDVELVGIFGKEFAENYSKAVQAFKKGKIKNVGVYNARDLLKTAMHRMFETGLPYITFLDAINNANPNKHDGYIPCANLCTESYSNVKADTYAHTCNLASIVVGRVDSDEEMIRLSKLATYILDNGIELTNSPISISHAHNERYRTIGVGIQGLHDYLAKNKKGYRDLDEITKLAELIEYGCVEQSIELAEQRGKYPAFDGSLWDTGELFDRFESNSVTELDWAKLRNECKKHGIRNSQLTSPAPNTSTSVFMDAAAGVQPVYAAFFIEDNKVGKFPVSGMHMKENPLEYERTFARQNQLDLVRAVGALQKFVDTGISAEYIFDQNREDFSAKRLWEVINEAWKEKTKAIYYIRTIKKGGSVDDLMGIETDCVGCSG